MKKSIVINTLATVVTTTMLSTALWADSDDATHSAAQQNAKISLVEAINIAEQATGGKSSEAEFEMEDGQAIYEVEVRMTDGTEIEVEIDAQSGTVLKQETEDDDHDEKDD
jgi:uncharacterized membrane protein YkoI